MSTQRPRAFSSPACLLHESEARRSLEPDVRIKRIYDPPARGDGLRILVDRLWPRGVTKERAAVHLWAKDLAPSPALRKWFNHEPGRFKQFGTRYRAELAEHESDIEALRARATRRRLTLLFAARDLQVNHAAVLRSAILEAAPTSRRTRPSSPRSRAR
jgi:uncharacterized protein YeaO (DUF488 family)